MSTSHVLEERFTELPQLIVASHYHPGELARLLKVPLRALERDCRKCFGVSPKALLDDAWRGQVVLLFADAVLVKEIVEAMGCTCLQHFSRKFKRIFGTSVEQWRKVHQKKCAVIHKSLSQNGNSKKLPSCSAVAKSKKFNRQ